MNEQDQNDILDLITKAVSPAIKDLKGEIDDIKRDIKHLNDKLDQQSQMLKEFIADQKEINQFLSNLIAKHETIINNTEITLKGMKDSIQI